MRLKESKLVRGGAEGSILVPATSLLGDAIITWVPWFEPRKEQLFMVLGAVLGAVLHKVAARLWGVSRA